MSVTKLLGRIVAPSANDFDISVAESGQALHDHTYGITSDPLTQFSCVLSALIHDGKTSPCDVYTYASCTFLLIFCVSLFV